MDNDNLLRVRLVKPLSTTCQLVGLRQACHPIAVGLVVFALALVLLGPAWAADGGLDPSFNPGVGNNYLPLLWDNKGYFDGSNKVLIGGSFTEVGGHATRGLARLMPDGTTDTSFTSPVTTGWVNNCYLLDNTQAESKILIAGNFTIIDPAHPDDPSYNYNGLARLNANGTLDTTFNRTFGVCPGMNGFGIQSDSKILVCGYALPVNGDPGHTYYLLRLDADGYVDDTYTKRSAPGGYVRSVGVNLSNNSARLLGCFPRIGAPTHLDYTVVLDINGNPVAGTNIGDEVVNGTILNIAFEGTTKMVIVGNFTQVYGTPMNGVARLLSTGGLDPAFNSIGTGANGYVQRVTLDPDPTGPGPKPVLAGYFTSFNGSPCGYMVRLNYNGSVDDSFNTGHIGADDRIWTMFKRSGDSKWVIEGAFQNVNGSSRKCIAVLNSDGTLFSDYSSFNIAHTGTGGTVYAMQDSPYGIGLGGTFGAFGGKYHSRLALLNYDGSTNQAFTTWTDGTVRAIRSQSDGQVLVAGKFGNVTGYIPRTGLARFNPDGTLDRAFNPVVVKADGSFADLYMVESQDDGKIMIGGDFNQIADSSHAMQPRTAFARLNGDGTLDPTFNAVMDFPDVTYVRVNAGGLMEGLYPIAGYVISGGVPYGFYTRLTNTGALDDTFGPTDPTPAPHVNLFNGEVRCGTDTLDGGVLVGGDFTAMVDGTLNPPQVGRIARFTANGLLDPTFAANPGANNPIHAIQRQRPNDKIFIGGDFTAYNGTVRNRVARINPNGSLDTNFDPGTGANATVYAVEWNDYLRKLRIGGAFTSYQDVSRPGVAQLFAGGGSISPVLFLLLLN